MSEKPSWLRRRPTYADIVSSLALFLALGGVSYAATQLPKDSVGSRQIKASAVTLSKISSSARSALKGQAGARGAAGAPGSTGAPGPAGPAGPAGSPGTVDTSAFYTKAQADGRYLRSTVVVVKTIAPSIAANSFAAATVTCPANFQAISGGVDVNGVFYGKVSESAPVFGAGSTRLEATGDGQQGPATGWQGAVSTQGTGTGTDAAKVAVICAPIG